MKATDPLYRRIAAAPASVTVVAIQMAAEVGASMQHHFNDVASKE